MTDTQTAHFWLGHFPSEQRFAAYLQEVRDEADPDREHTPLSEFARDQGETWYDHDFFEHGFLLDAQSVEELVRGYSYSDQWTAEIARRATAEGLTAPNTLVFIVQDQIANPRTVRGDGYSLHYLGTVTYNI